VLDAVRAGAHRDAVVDEVDVDVEHLAGRVRDCRRPEPAPGEVERHVRPLRLERREREAHLADHLELHVQRVARVLPLLVSERRPEHQLSSNAISST